MKNQGGWYSTLLMPGVWGSTKFSAPFPRGVHAARQKHAPCVDMVRKLRYNTTAVHMSRASPANRADLSRENLYF